ncbi:MAG: D-amino acid aminotransferase [Gemmatimonadaceae bacterium]|nr:D-amino acid aminotransferase [Gemmatimonadaceae bacterium]
MRTCWLNGSFVPEDEAHVSIFDRGLLFGDGVYEVAAVFQGRLLDADRHLVRLERSLRELAMPSPYTAAAWLEVMQALATQNRIDEGLVYLQVTRGAAERDFAFPAAIKPTAFAYARSKRLSDDPAAAGLTVHVVPDIRWGRCDIKSTAMLAQVLAKQAAREAGAAEALMHEDGVVTEGGSSNIWIAQDGALHTRPLSSDILAGITRDVVIEVARELNIPVVERAFTVDQAIAADECFLTSATSFVLPITRIDAAVVGNGAPGPITQRIRDGYLARAARLTGDSAALSRSA